jgi:hypothetical protein
VRERAATAAAHGAQDLRKAARESAVARRIAPRRRTTGYGPFQAARGGGDSGVGRCVRNDSSPIATGSIERSSNGGAVNRDGGGAAATADH